MCNTNNDIRTQLRREARERLAMQKAERGICLDLDDIANMSKEQRIKLAKYMCDKEFE